MLRNIPNHYFVYLFAALLLIMVWVFPYFVTGDGPCHLYNAVVLNDFLHHKNTAFYSQYYSLTQHASPNWFTHYFLVGFMQVFSPMVSEKFLISFCILSMLGGFYFLLKQISTPHFFYFLLFIPLLFQDAFYKGFYNYILSIGLYFYLVGYYIRFVKDPRFWNALFFSFMCVLLFYVHLIGLVLLFLTAGVYSLIHFIQAHFLNKEKFIPAAAITLKSICMLIPSLALTLFFVAEKGISPSNEENPVMHYLYNLLTLKSLVTISTFEKYAVPFFAISILFGFTISTIIAFKKIKTWNKYYITFFIVSSIVLLGYIVLHDNYFGGGILHIRIEVLLYCYIILLLAIQYKDVAVPLALRVIAVLWVSLFLLFKIPCYYKSNNMMNELVQNEPFIKPYSFVLPLSLHHNGVYNNALINLNRNHALHCSEYIGTKKPLLFADNYEALSGLFPLTWKEENNPWLHLSQGLTIESETPDYNLKKFEAVSTQVDYVLLFNVLHSDTLENTYKKIRASLDTDYSLIHTNKDRSIFLFQKK